MVGILQLPPILICAASCSNVRSVSIEAAGPALYSSSVNPLTPDVTLFAVYPVVSPQAKYKPYSSGDVAPTLQVAHFKPEGKPKSTYSYSILISTKYLTLISSFTKDTFGLFNTPPI